MGRKSTKATDGQQMTEHQGVGGQTLEERSLRSGTNRWERSDPKPEETQTRKTESSQRGPKGDGEGDFYISIESRLN